MYKLLYKIIYIKITIFFQHIGISFGNNNFLENLQEILDYSEQRMPKPTTFMLNIFETRKSPFDWNIVTEKPIIHTIESVLRDPEDYLILEKQTRLRWKGLFSFIVIYWLFDEAQIDPILAEIDLIVNPRRDRLIICGTEEIIKILITKKCIQNFKEKILFDIKGTIFTDPPSYDAGKLMQIRKISKKPEFNPTFGGNIRGVHLKLATCEFSPWHFKIFQDKYGHAVVDGTAPRIMQEVGKKLNFTYETTYSGYNYATQLENKTWTGQYSEVFYRKSDISFHCHDISYTYGVDNPSYGLVLTPINILYIVPIGSFQLYWYAFLLPLELKVWIASIVTFILFVVIQYVIMFLKNGRKHSNKVLDTAYLVPFGLLTEQGLTNIPQGVRYTSLFLLFAGTIIGTGYRSTLRANLSFPTREDIPMTVEELAERRDYDINMYKYGSVEVNYIKYSLNPALIKIQKRIRYNSDFVKCIHSSFLEEKTACLSWDVAFKIQTALTMTINSQFEPMVYSTPIRRLTCNLVFQKNSKYADSFTGIIGGLIESNIYKKWENEIFHEAKVKGRKTLLKNKEKSLMYKKLQEKMLNDDSGESSLTFWSLRVVFGMIPVGGFLSGILLIIEFLYKCRENVYDIKSDRRASIELNTFCFEKCEDDVKEKDVEVIEPILMIISKYLKIYNKAF